GAGRQHVRPGPGGLHPRRLRQCSGRSYARACRTPRRRRWAGVALGGHPAAPFCATLLAFTRRGTMTEAKLAPNLPDWMVQHANRYISSGGTEGHFYKTKLPDGSDITAPALLLTTTGRKSGQKLLLPLFYGKAGNSYFVVASKGGAPQHPGW